MSAASFGRLAYLGTPTMSVPTLRALLHAGYPVTDVVTRADTRRGRGSTTSPSPVKSAAMEAGMSVHHRVDDLLGQSIDLGVVVAFGQLIKPHVLAEIPMVNLHFSLLPRWRGAAPVERAMLTGDDVTGVCLMQLDEGLDTGPIYDRVEVPIGPRTTGSELREQLVAVGTAMLLDNLGRGLGTPVTQHGAPTYAHKVAADELRLDWSRPAVELDRIVRLGGAWTTWRGRRFKIGRASLIEASGEPGRFVGDPADGVVAGAAGALVFHDVQPEGKPPMAWLDYQRGARPTTGESFGE